MNENVKVLIRGIQHEFGDESLTETNSKGHYYLRNGKHYILYEEVVPETGEQIGCTLKIAPKQVEIYKNGTNKIHMVFAEGAKCFVNYPTMFGQMNVLFDTSKLTVKESDSEISVNIQYGLEINEEFVSKCTIDIQVYN